MSTPSDQDLLAAATCGDTAHLRTWLSTPPLPPPTTLSALLAAASLSNHPPTAALLLQHGAPLTHAVAAAAHRGGTLPLYQFLVPAGLDVNLSFGHAGGALTEAVLADDLAWVRYLLDSGADPELAPLYGNRAALAVAAASGAGAEIVRALVEAGAETGYKGLLALAVEAGNGGFVEFILGEGASVDERVEESFFVGGEGSVLHLAVGMGRVEVVRLLVERGADGDVRDREGRTPLEKAREMGKADIVELFGG